jgi:hypothetical protein
LLRMPATFVTGCFSFVGQVCDASFLRCLLEVLGDGSKFSTFRLQNSFQFVFHKVFEVILDSHPYFSTGMMNVIPVAGAPIWVTSYSNTDNRRMFRIPQGHYPFSSLCRIEMVLSK